MRARNFILAGALLALAACDGEDPVNAALRDAAAARHAAEVQVTADVEPGTGETGTASPDRAAALKLADEHRAAITSAERQLAGITDPELRGLTEAGIAARRREVTALEGWLSDTD